MHGLCRRRVLDQLDQPVAVDHLARRQGEVATRREGRQIDDAETAFLQVVQQVARPIGEAGPAGLHGPAQGVGIRHQQQRRAHGIDELAQVEVQALPLRLIHALDFALFQQPVRGQQVQLLEGAVDRVVAPFRRREPLVGRGRRRSLGLVGAGHAPPALARLVPDVHGGAPERHVQVRARGHGLLGLSQGVQPDGAQRTSDLRPIDRHDLAQRIGVPHLVDGAQEWVLGDDVVELLHATGQHVVDEVVGRHLPPGFVGVDPVPGGAEISLHPGHPQAQHHVGPRRAGIGVAAPLCPTSRRNLVLPRHLLPAFLIGPLGSHDVSSESSFAIPAGGLVRCAPSLVLDKLSWRCRRGRKSGSDSDRPGCLMHYGRSPSTDSPDFLPREWNRAAFCVIGGITPTLSDTNRRQPDDTIV